ncbi:MAG: hypothetical protein EAZ30_16145 [Betaproteobacteria bacterium]|nr:MAG: hypothetical protein EAZ30_16145 [Betaproteobacteria bacterium]
MDVWFAHLQPNSINLLTDATGQYRTVADADAMGTEFGNARVWAGIHTRYAVDAGRRLGQRVAEEVFKNAVAAAAEIDACRYCPHSWKGAEQMTRVTE